MSQEQPNDPLHGITLEQIVTELVDYYGWHQLGYRIQIRCFNQDPSIKSSLKFLRKTPWARQKVEYLYLDMQR
jgi:uncharacterized protein (DUF2132 family)